MDSEDDTGMPIGPVGWAEFLRPLKGNAQVMARFGALVREATEDQCNHDWIHDGDGALYCAKCKALDPYSNEREQSVKMECVVCGLAEVKSVDRSSPLEWFCSGCNSITTWKDEGDTDGK